MITKKQLLIAVGFISAIAVASSANLAGAAVEWTPLVRIPGLPPTGTVNLSMYLIGLYNFMLSVVGIVAVVMLIIGGMRYITAVGNPTAISDAKDIIISAITGLILALLSWVFISAINPDVLYIKQPGSGIIDPSLAVKDLATVPVTTTPTPCIAPGSPVSANSLNYKTEPYNSRCQCIDLVFITPVAGVSCQDTCKTGNCLVADARIGNVGNTGFNPGTVNQKSVIIYIKDPCTESLVFDAYKTFSLNPYTCSWDFESDGTADNPSCFTGFCPIPGLFITGTYTATLTVTDTVTGVTSTDTVVYDAINP